MDYQKTLSVLQSAEKSVSVGKALWPSQPTFRAFTDTVLGGPWLVLAGAGVLARRSGWILIAWATFTLFLGLLERGEFRQVVGPAFILAFGAVYFAMPSQMVLAAVKAENVKEVRQKILASVANSIELECLQEGVAILRADAGEKLGRFNVLAGVTWGVLFWFIATHALAPDLTPEATGWGLSYGLAAALVFVFVLMAGLCRAIAVRAVYQTLEFAVLEAKATLANVPIQNSPIADASGQARAAR